MLFWVCEAIVGYFWLLKVISPYVIINYGRTKTSSFNLPIWGYFK
jgi:hypothetical protein